MQKMAKIDVFRKFCQKMCKNILVLTLKIVVYLGLIWAEKSFLRVKNNQGQTLLGKILNSLKIMSLLYSFWSKNDSF